MNSNGRNNHGEMLPFQKIGNMHLRILSKKSARGMTPMNLSPKPKSTSIIALFLLETQGHYQVQQCIHAHDTKEGGVLTIGDLDFHLLPGNAAEEIQEV